MSTWYTAACVECGADYITFNRTPGQPHRMTCSDKCMVARARVFGRKGGLASKAARAGVLPSREPTGSTGR